MRLKLPMMVTAFSIIDIFSVSQLNAATSYHCRLTVINNGYESQGKVAFDGATPMRMKVAGYRFSVSLRKIDLSETSYLPTVLPSTFCFCAPPLWADERWG